MLFNIKKVVKFLKIFIAITFILVIFNIDLFIYTRIFNQYKNLELSKFLNKKAVSLVIQTVTGDQRFKNKELDKQYKELQIIHILVISGSNITLILGFIHIFIYRKNMTNYIMSLFFILIYGKLIFFPETLIRALQSIAILKINEYKGIKFSNLRSLLILLSTFVLSYFFFKLNNSYILSSIFSIVIFINSNFIAKIVKNKIIRFTLCNLILSLTSAILFNMKNFPIICTSFFANIFISLIYDSAILIAYILYIMPTELFPDILIRVIFLFFEYLFISINLIKAMTYNVCYE